MLDPSERFAIASTLRALSAICCSRSKSRLVGPKLDLLGRSLCRCVASRPGATRSAFSASVRA
eukprot:8561808-Pyramimonas_sp.AAC.1